VTHAVVGFPVGCRQDEILVIRGVAVALLSRTSPRAPAAHPPRADAEEIGGWSFGQPVDASSRLLFFERGLLSVRFQWLGRLAPLPTEAT
jgi:hypothetical protein